MANMKNKTNIHKREPVLAFAYNNVQYFNVNITGAKRGHIYTEDNKKLENAWKSLKQQKEELKKQHQAQIKQN